MAGPHILEKCCHDLDLINWFCDSLPSKIASFGGLDYFVPENQHHMDKYGKDTYAAWNDPHRVDSPFTADKDLMDNQVGIMQYRNGIRVMFQATMSNAIRNAGCIFHVLKEQWLLNCIQAPCVTKR